MQKKILLTAGISHQARVIENALAQAAALTPTASYRQLVELVYANPAPRREYYVTLLRDVLCQYPEMVYGVPVLMYVAADSSEPLELPLPDYQPPETAVTRCSWLGIDALRNEGPFGVPSGRVRISPHRIEAAVMRVWCQGESKPQLTDEWWGDVFRQLPGAACLATGSALPWPDAVEAACAMLANTRGSQEFAETPQLFLPFEDYVLAQEAGRKFREKVKAFEFGPLC